MLRCHIANVHAERYEVAEALVLARYSELRAAGEQVGNVSAGLNKRVGCRAAEPLFRERLVEIEWSHVREVGVAEVGAVWKGARDLRV